MISPEYMRIIIAPFIVTLICSILAYQWGGFSGAKFLSRFTLAFMTAISFLIVPVGMLVFTYTMGHCDTIGPAPAECIHPTGFMALLMWLDTITHFSSFNFPNFLRNFVHWLAYGWLLWSLSLFAGIDRYFLQLIARFRFLSLLLGYAIIVAAGLALDGLLMEDPSLFLYLFLLIGLVEIAAYFSNIHYGKHLLFPRLNSKKTWEGFACSAIVTVIFSAAWGAFYLHFSANILISFILLSLVVFAVSVTGTLFKNLLERAAAIQSHNSRPPKYAWLSIDYPLAILAAAPVFCFGISLILVHVRPWLNFL